MDIVDPGNQQCLQGLIKFPGEHPNSKSCEVRKPGIKFGGRVEARQELGCVSSLPQNTWQEQCKEVWWLIFTVNSTGFRMAMETNLWA